MSAHPQPHRDDDNAAFLDAWRDGRLLAQRCADCARAFFYPRAFCPHCWSDRIQAIECTGQGTIVSYSLVWRPNDAAFDGEVPIILAEVVLDEGASLLARIVDASPDTVRSGMAVALPMRERRTNFPLPVFCLARSAPG
jgi:uncharacterized OB-fold protein